MRILASLAIATLAASVAAQSNGTLTTPPNYAGGNGGNQGGGVYFDLTVYQDICISQLDFNIYGTAATTGTLKVYLGPNTWLNNNVRNPSLWTNVATYTGPCNPNGQASLGVLNNPIGLAGSPGGTTYGVALESDAAAFAHGYTNGTGANQTITFNDPGTGQPVLTFTGGGAQNAFLSTGGIFTPRIFNGAFHFTYGPAACPPVQVAAWDKFGPGCYDFDEAFYEDYPNPSSSFDLSGQTLKLEMQNPTFPSYRAVAGSGTWYTPVGGFVNPLPLGGNSVMIVPDPNSASPPPQLPFPLIVPDGSGGVITPPPAYLEVSENGWVTPTDALGSVSNAADPAGRDVNAFLSGAPRWCTWHDFDANLVGPNGGIFYDVDPSGLAFYITWLQVPTAPGTSTLVNVNDFQLAFSVNPSNGGTDVEFRWIIQGSNTQAIGEGAGGTWPAMVGWSTGGGAADPLSRDLYDLATMTLNVPFETAPVDNDPLDLTMSARPLLGTTPNLVYGGIPTGGTLPNGPFTQAILGVTLGSFTPVIPAASLGALGMPGCFQNILFQQTLSVWIPTAGNPQLTQPFGIPNDPILNGVAAVLQAGSLSPASPGFNALGGISSNGLRIVVGSL